MLFLNTFTLQGMWTLLPFESQDWHLSSREHVTGKWKWKKPQHWECMHRTHFVGIVYKLAHIKQMLVHFCVVVGTVCSGHQVTLKIEVTLSLLGDALIHTSWISYSMLPAIQLFHMGKAVAATYPCDMSPSVCRPLPSLCCSWQTQHLPRVISCNFLLSLFCQGDR